MDCGGDTFAILNQRLPWKQAGCMTLRTHALLHDIEMRHSSFLEREEVSDILGVMFGRALRRDLALNAMHVAARDVRRRDEKFLGELVITSRIGRRNGALVNPEQMDRFPAITGFHQLLEQQLGRAATRDREGGVLLPRQRIVQQRENVVSRGFGRRMRIRIRTPMDAHGVVASFTANARAASYVGSWPGMDSS